MPAAKPHVNIVYKHPAVPILYDVPETPAKPQPSATTTTTTTTTITPPLAQAVVRKPVVTVVRKPTAVRVARVESTQVKEVDNTTNDSIGVAVETVPTTRSCRLGCWFLYYYVLWFVRLFGRCPYTPPAAIPSAIQADVEVDGQPRQRHPNSQDVRHYFRGQRIQEGWEDPSQGLYINSVQHARFRTDPHEDCRLVQDQSVRRADGDFEVGRMALPDSESHSWRWRIVYLLMSFIVVAGVVVLTSQLEDVPTVEYWYNATKQTCEYTQDWICWDGFESDPGFEEFMSQNQTYAQYEGSSVWCHTLDTLSPDCVNQPGFDERETFRVNAWRIVGPILALFVCVVLVVSRWPAPLVELGQRIDYIPHALSALVYEMSMNPSLEDLETNWAARWRRVTSSLNIPDSENLALRNGTFAAARVYIQSSDSDFLLSHSRSTRCDKLFAGVS